jgi:hypothetical protein
LESLPCDSIELVNRANEDNRCVSCVCEFTFDLFIMFIVFILVPCHKSRESVKIGPPPRGHPTSRTLAMSKQILKSCLRPLPGAPNVGFCGTRTRVPCEGPERCQTEGAEHVIRRTRRSTATENSKHEKNTARDRHTILPRFGAIMRR